MHQNVPAHTGIHKTQKELTLTVLSLGKQMLEDERLTSGKYILYICLYGIQHVLLPAGPPLPTT